MSHLKTRTCITHLLPETAFLPRFRCPGPSEMTAVVLGQGKGWAPACAATCVMLADAHALTDLQLPCFTALPKPNSSVTLGSGSTTMADIYIVLVAWWHGGMVAGYQPMHMARDTIMHHAKPEQSMCVPCMTKPAAWKGTHRTGCV